MTKLKVQASDTAAAMDEIYAKLGPDALILSTTKQNGKVVMEATTDTSGTRVSSREFQDVFAGKMIDKPENSEKFLGAKKGGHQTSLADLREDIRRMSHLVEGLIITDDNGINNGLRNNPAIRLRSMGFTPRIVSELRESFVAADNHTGLQNFFSSMAAKLAHPNPEKILDSEVIFVVGPSGSGRTTIAGKIIGLIRDQKINQRIMLAKMQDSSKNDRELQTLSRLLNVPYCSFSADTPLSAFTNLTDAETLVVDVNGSDSITLKTIEALDKEIGQKKLSVILTIPGSTSSSMISLLAGQYKRITPIVALTKLDECEATPTELSCFAQHGTKIGILSGTNSLVDNVMFASEHILLEYLQETYSEAAN